MKLEVSNLNNKFNLENLLSGINNLYRLELKEYNLLLELTKRQSKAISDDDFEGLSRLIVEKEKSMKKVDELEEKIKLYKRKLAFKLGIEIDDDFLFNLLQEDIPLKEELKDTVKNIHNTLLKIQDLDKANQNNLNEKKTRTVKVFFKVKKGLNVIRSYNYNFNKEAKFIDKRG